MQATISEYQFAKLCAAAWLRVEAALQQLGDRKVSAAIVVFSEIVSGLCAYFGVDADRRDRRHDMSRIDAVMVNRMQPLFDYALIADRYAEEAERRYGGAPTFQRPRRSLFVKKRYLQGRGKQDFRRKRV